MDDPRPGDCMRACMASLLELRLSEVPHFADAEDWYGAWRDWLWERGWRLTTAYMRVEPDDPMTLTGYTQGYWLGVVRSPRVVRDGEPGLHLVVMRDDRIVWDPSPLGRGEGAPEYAGHLGFVSGYYLAPVDPARFELR